MPEDGAIHGLTSTMNKLFTGESVLASSPQGRFTALAEKINGHVLERIHVHGKHMLIGFVPPEAVGSESQEWIHIHLGLYGQWHFNSDEGVVDEGHGIAHRIAPVAKREWDGHSETRWGEDYGQAARSEQEPSEPIGQVRLRIYNEHAVADFIGPNCCELISDEERIAAQAELGPGPLDEGTREDRETAERFAEITHAKKRAIGKIVMDQIIIAGVGNIYRAGALFLARISPYHRGSSISARRLTSLWVLIYDLMNRGLVTGRLETVDPLEVPNPPLESDEEASCQYVYHRTGRPCLCCGTPVREALIQNRHLFWCPSCQC